MLKQKQITDTTKQIRASCLELPCGVNRAVHTLAWRRDRTCFLTCHVILRISTVAQLILPTSSSVQTVAIDYVHFAHSVGRRRWELHLCSCGCQDDMSSTTHMFVRRATTTSSSILSFLCTIVTTVPSHEDSRGSWSCVYATQDNVATEPTSDN